MRKARFVQAYLLSVAVLLASWNSAAAQQVELLARAGLGYGPGWVSSGADATAWLGGKLEFRPNEWGGYIALQRRMIPQACTFSCSSPHVTETSAGVVRRARRQNGIRPYGSGGIGIVHWSDADLFVESEAGVLIHMIGGLSCQLGLRGMVSLDRERTHSARSIDLLGGLALTLPFF